MACSTLCDTHYKHFHATHVPAERLAIDQTLHARDDFKESSADLAITYATQAWTELVFAIITGALAIAASSWKPAEGLSKLFGEAGKVVHTFQLGNQSAIRSAYELLQHLALSNQPKQEESIGAHSKEAHRHTDEYLQTLSAFHLR